MRPKFYIHLFSASHPPYMLTVLIFEIIIIIIIIIADDKL